MQDLTPQFNTAQIKAMILQRAERLEAAALSRLQRVGERFVENARNMANFTDRTGVLRSSISYVVLKNGLQVSGGDFVLVKEGADGIVAGKALLEDMARRFPVGLVLVGVAGASYAAAVESKSFDVITGSSLIAKEALQKAIEELQGKIK